MSSSTLQRAGDAFLGWEIDLLAVKGKRESTRIYQPPALKGDNSKLEAIINRYALRADGLRGQQWDGSL